MLRLQVRSLQLGEVPLTSLAAIAAADAEQGHTPAVLLAGSYDSHVYAYAPGPGRQLGAFAGHSDAASCLHLLAPDQLLTASWDCSIKLWRWVLGVKACCAGATRSNICCASSRTPEACLGTAHRRLTLFLAALALRRRRPRTLLMTGDCMAQPSAVAGPTVLLQANGAL